MIRRATLIAFAAVLMTLGTPLAWLGHVLLWWAGELAARAEPVSHDTFVGRWPR